MKWFLLICLLLSGCVVNANKAGVYAEIKVTGIAASIAGIDLKIGIGSENTCNHEQIISDTSRDLLIDYINRVQNPRDNRRTDR